MHARSHSRLLATINSALARLRGNSHRPVEGRDRAIASLRFRLGGVLALRECLRLIFAWTMLWATAVVGLRAVFRIDAIVLLWGLLGLAAAAAAGVVLGRRKLPSVTAIRAALDRHGRLGGLLMAAGDVDIGAWNAQIARVPLPALQWRSRRQWMLLITSTAFLVAAFLAPDRYLPSGGETGLQIGGEMQKLTEKIQALKEEQILPPEKAQVLERDLDRVRQEALGKDPAKTMEALDHLEQSLSKAAADAAEMAIKQTETAARTQELAEALQAAQGQMDPKQFGQAMKELAHMAEQAAADNKDLEAALSEELKEACQKGLLSDAQLRDLCKAPKECKECERARLVKLIDAKLIDAAELGELVECENAGEGDEAAADRCPVPMQGRQPARRRAGIVQSRIRREGWSRGRWPARRDDLAAGSQQRGAKFKEKVLQPAAAVSLKKSRLAGISVGDPTSVKTGGGSSGGALGTAQAGGGEAHTQLILPEYEKTIQRYFDRAQK